MRYEVQVQWALVPDRWVTVKVNDDEKEIFYWYEFYRDRKPTALNVQLLKLEATVIAEASKKVP